MLFHNVHYPNGETKKHKARYDDDFCGFHPKIDKVFYNGDIHYRIDEMSEEDIWVEEIPKTEYSSILNTFGIVNRFAYFHYRLDMLLNMEAPALMDYKP